MLPWTAFLPKLIQLGRKDRGTGADLTDSRRNEIYDICIPNAQFKVLKKI